MTHAPFASLERSLGEHLHCVSSFALRLALLIIVLLAALAFAYGAHAAPKAGDREECFAVTDMGITARALAEEGLGAEAVVRVLDRMYHEKLTAKWALALATAAAGDKRPAKEFARALFSQCVQNQGNLDGVLGVAL